MGRHRAEKARARQRRQQKRATRQRQRAEDRRQQATARDRFVERLIPDDIDAPAWRTELDGPLPDHRAVEGVMAQLGGADGARPVDHAQAIMYDAWDTRDRIERVLLARKALDICADCADAYVLLAEETANSVEEALELLAQGVAAGERALGPACFQEDAGHFWALLGTRPYMRARAGLAQCCWSLGRRDEAIDHWWELLRLNPSDNQGIRDGLAAALLELGRDDALDELLARYDEDTSPGMRLPAALLAFRRVGDHPDARAQLAAACKWNPHLLDFLLGRRPIPATTPPYLAVGEPDEAAEHARVHAPLWRATPGALDWLARATAT